MHATACCCPLLPLPPTTRRRPSPKRVACPQAVAAAQRGRDLVMMPRLFLRFAAYNAAAAPIALAACVSSDTVLFRDCPRLAVLPLVSGNPQ